MNTDPEPPPDESEFNIQPGITRRSFVKRTTATAIVTVLALHAFRSEALAQEVVSGSKAYTLVLNSFAPPESTTLFIGTENQTVFVVGTGQQSDTFVWAAVVAATYSKFTEPPPFPQDKGTLITYDAAIASFRLIKGTTPGATPIAYSVQVSCAAELKSGKVKLALKDVSKPAITPTFVPASGSSESTESAGGLTWKVKVQDGAAAFVKFSVSVSGTFAGVSLTFGNDIEFSWQTSAEELPL